MSSYARYTQELGHLPTAGELRLKRRADANFPSWNTFGRFGSKAQLVKRVRDHCQSNVDLASVVALCDGYLCTANVDSEAKQLKANEVVIGFVYLIRSGRFYKIGKSNSAGRREYELSIQLPERPEMVHVIHTDDPSGIEDYWHRRFAAKRLNGEWFDLDAADIAAFKGASLCGCEVVAQIQISSCPVYHQIVMLAGPMHTPRSDFHRLG